MYLDIESIHSKNHIKHLLEWKNQQTVKMHMKKFFVLQSLFFLFEREYFNGINSYYSNFFSVTFG